MVCYSSICLPFGVAMRETASVGHPDRGDWESASGSVSTNPHKRLSGYKVEMRGSGEERTENRLELTIIQSPAAPASSKLKYQRWADYFGIAECFCVAFRVEQRVSTW